MHHKHFNCSWVFFSFQRMRSISQCNKFSSTGASSLADQFQWRIIYIIWGILHCILLVDTSITVTQFRGCFDYDHDCLIPLRRGEDFGTHSPMPLSHQSRTTQFQKRNSIQPMFHVQFQVQLGFHGSCMRDMEDLGNPIEIIPGPRPCITPKEVILAMQPAYITQPDLSPRSPYRVFTPSIPTSQSNLPTSKL